MRAHMNSKRKQNPKQLRERRTGWWSIPPWRSIKNIEKIVARRLVEAMDDV